MVREGMRNVAAGANPMVLKKGIQKAVDVLVEELQAVSKKVETKEAKAQVASISAADEEIGGLIADAMEKVGDDGVITVEESKTMETCLETVEGMQFDRGYISPYMATDPDKMEAVLNNPLVLITDRKITMIQDIMPVLEKVVQGGRELLIIAEDIEGEALATLVVNKLRGTFKAVLLKLLVSVIAVKLCCRTLLSLQEQLLSVKKLDVSLTAPAWKIWAVPARFA